MCPQCHSRGWPPGPRAGTPVPSGSRKQTRVAARGPGVTCGAAQRDDAGGWGERTHLPGARRDAPTSPSATGWSPAAPPLPARARPWERAPGVPTPRPGKQLEGDWPAEVPPPSLPAPSPGSPPSLPEAARGGSRSGAQTQRRTWLVRRHLAGRAPGAPSPSTGRRVQTRCYSETMDGTRLQSRCRLGPGAPGRPRGARSDAAASPPLCS